MLPSATALSVALYLLPVVAVLVTRWRTSTALWRMALTLPEVVAFDMLGVMLLARFVRLETAILISRPAWLIGACAAFATNRRVSQRLPAGHRTLALKHALAATAAAVGAFQMSALISRPFHLWDRHWHVPLATLFRAEKIPFDNAYDPGRLLHYHVTGDVLGSMLQTLSLGVVNSSLALSVAHDVMFGLIAASATLLLFAFDFKRLWLAPIASIALLLQGPATMHGNLGHDFYGYSFDSLLIAGFRPHVPLAGLLIVGCVGSTAVRLRRGAGIRPAETLPVLVASGVLLSITDEASMGIIVVALACAWCVAPAAVSRTRFGGILGLALLGTGSIGAHWLFNGSLAPGGPVQSIRWVDARSPGTQGCEPLALTTVSGQVALLFDLLPLLACAVGLTIACLKRPRAFGTLVFAGAALTTALILFTRIEINHAHAEAQRFMIAPSFVVLLLALLYLPRVSAGSLASALVTGGLVLAAFCTTSWLQQRLSDADSERVARDPLNLHTLNCRESTGARLGEKPTLAYFDSKVFGAYVGCRPSYGAGRVDSQWLVKMFPDLWALPQLTELDAEMVAPNANLVAICPTRPTSDVVCVEAGKRGTCVDEGTEVRRCSLSPADRKLILALLVASGAPR